MQKFFKCSLFPTMRFSIEDATAMFYAHELRHDDMDSDYARTIMERMRIGDRRTDRDGDVWERTQ